MEKIRFFPHPADIEFEVYGRSFEEVFKLAAETVCEVITPRKSVKPVKEKKIRVKSEDLEALLYDFLEQILLLHDAENLVFSEVEIEKFEINGKYEIKARLKGEEFDPARHESGTVVKAITYHEMKIGRKRIQGRECCFAHVVLDI